ncbi:hypothetical protein ACOMHN_047614 [Nucella lapillus]
MGEDLSLPDPPQHGRHPHPPGPDPPPPPPPCCLPLLPLPGLQDYRTIAARLSDRTPTPRHASVKGKPQGSVRKRPEITIVDARPMSQAGFRDMKASDPAPGPHPGVPQAKDENTVKPPPTNGALPAIPSRPPPTSSATLHSTPHPSHSPPPIPSSRPGCPPSLPPAHPEKPPPDHPLTQDPEPPLRSSQPTILRPARPKSAIVTGNQPLGDSMSSPPPPPLPKRSPMVSEAPAPGDLIDFDPPPKPARLIQGTEESQREEKEGEGGEEGEGGRKGKGGESGRRGERGGSCCSKETDANEPQEGGSQHLPRPRPPPPASRPVAVVSATPREDPELDYTQCGDVEQPRASARPVPAARPRSSPKEGPPEEGAGGRSPVASARTVPQSAVADQGSKPPPADPEKAAGAPDRPRPPGPASRPQGPPPAVPTTGASPRLSQKVGPSKPPPPAAVGASPASHPPVSVKEGALPPPLVPSKPPATCGGVPGAGGSLYAVSEPLETTDSFTKFPPPSGSQPSRPPPPVPKSRPRSTAQSSPMLGRPLPSVPVETSTDTPSSGQAQCYEDIECVKAQAQTWADLPAQQDSPSPRENTEAADEAKYEKDLSAMYATVHKPHEAKTLLKPNEAETVNKPNEAETVNKANEAETVNKPNEAKCEEDTSGMYARVNKPNKHNNSDAVTSSPFGVTLKHIPPEDSPESEPPPVPPKLSSDELEELSAPAVSPKPKPELEELSAPAVSPKPKPELEELSAPAVSPKPKPSLSAKPQVAAKPKSPRKEEMPLELPEASATKTESSEQKKPPLAAKRPTIIRPPKPPPKAEKEASEARAEIEKRENGSQEVQQTQAEVSSSGDGQTSGTGRPPPPDGLSPSSAYPSTDRRPRKQRGNSLG